MTEQAKRVKVTKTRGEDVKAGEDVVLEDKHKWRVLRNERGIGGGISRLMRIRDKVL